MGMKHSQTKIEQETQQWQPGTGITSDGPRFQNLSKIAPQNASFWPFWVSRMSMEGAICIETNLDDE